MFRFLYDVNFEIFISSDYICSMIDQKLGTNLDIIFKKFQNKTKNQDEGLGQRMLKYLPINNLFIIIEISSSTR